MERYFSSRVGGVQARWRRHRTHAGKECQWSFTNREDLEKACPKNVPRKDAPKHLFLTQRFACKRDSAARAFQKTDMRQVVAKRAGPGTGGAEGMVEYVPIKGCPAKRDAP